MGGSAHDRLDLVVDLSVRAERATALYRALLDAVREGRLRAGDLLPPSRALAADLGVSRSTVTTAYERLVAEGHLVAVSGSGTRVADVVPDRVGGSGRSGVAGDAPTGLRPRAGWTWAPQTTSGTRPEPELDLRPGVPDAGLFPVEVWRRLVAARTRRGLLRHTYPGPGGHPALREALARHLLRSRGVAADADDVVVTHGTSHGLDLLCRVLLAPGDVVAVEDPGYPSARELFASHGATVVPVPVDAEGLVVDRVPPEARLVFVTPSHQFPLGPPLSLARRHALLAHARAHGTAIAEDDYDSEFRFAPRPLEPLHRLDRDGLVVYVGTLSKSLLPALRLGFLVAPPGLRDALRAARQLGDGFGAPATELALADFLDDGHMARHLRRATATYAGRREALRAALHERLGLVPEPSSAGLHLSVRWPADVDAATARARVAAARAAGIGLEALEDYALLPEPRRGLVLGIGALDEGHVEEAVRRLAAVVAAHP